MISSTAVGAGDLASRGMSMPAQSSSQQRVLSGAPTTNAHRPHSYHGNPEEALAEMPPGDAPAIGEAGVGLVFKRDDDGRNCVFSVVKDSPADEVGVVNIGDILMMVDAMSTDGLSLTKLRKYIVGPPHSVVSLTFKRPESEGYDGQYTVDLCRSTVQTRRGEHRSLEEIEAELDKVRGQAIEETKLRAAEELGRREEELVLRKARARRQEAEEQIEFLLSELKRSHEELAQADDELIQTKTQCAQAKQAMEEKIFEADNARTAAEYELRKAKRDSICGFLANLES